MFRSKKYKARFLCKNCGKVFAFKVPFAVLPVRHGDFCYFVSGQSFVDEYGLLVSQPKYLNCTKCGSYTLQKIVYELSGAIEKE